LRMWEVTHVGKYLEVLYKNVVVDSSGVVFENVVVENYVGGMGHRHMVVGVHDQSEIHHILGLGMCIGKGMAYCSMEEVTPPKIDAPIP